MKIVNIYCLLFALLLSQPVTSASSDFNLNVDRPLRILPSKGNGKSIFVNVTDRASVKDTHIISQIQRRVIEKGYVLSAQREKSSYIMNVTVMPLQNHKKATPQLATAVPAPEWILLSHVASSLIDSEYLESRTLTAILSLQYVPDDAFNPYKRKDMNERATITVSWINEQSSNKNAQEAVRVLGRAIGDLM